ncbi:hypothetical protein GIW81_00745 [Hyphomicrobium sp. xq]|uniref:Uncharacterized protein n=1 Tax=Hyphomicrobium album TaxID=2665159 RepID=A0A6I3KBQ4_9HYPH|nr:helix-turn-helix domain-containing protein [Hyphomicrobium album]MTD92855.1 hypothetical protein [Hyphomicrobium album]
MPTAIPRLLSRLKRPGFINSWPKAILAAGFFALTNYVIFEDVLRHGSTITTDHLLSFAVLVGTFASGHWFWPTLVSKEYGTAAGLALLFVAGTVYCVLTSAGRNAEALVNKAAKVTADNGPYAAQESKVKGAEGQRAEAKAKLTEAETEAKDATKKADAACVKHGADSWRCETARKNEDAAEGRKAKAQDFYDGKTNTYWMEDAGLRLMAKKDTNVDLKYAAKVLNYIPHVSVTEDQLADIIPFVKSVFCEFATLLFAAGAFGHRRETVPEPPKEPETVPPLQDRPTEPSRDRPAAPPLRLVQGGTVPSSQVAALVLLRQHLAVHGTVSQSDLRSLLGDVSKQTVSRWCDDWEADGHICRTLSGRTRMVSLKPAARRIAR